MTAFATYKDAECVEHCPTLELAAFSLTRVVTSGVKTVIGKNEAQATKGPGTNV